MACVRVYIPSIQYPIALFLSHFQPLAHIARRPRDRPRVQYENTRPLVDQQASSPWVGFLRIYVIDRRSVPIYHVDDEGEGGEIWLDFRSCRARWCPIWRLPAHMLRRAANDLLWGPPSMLNCGIFRLCLSRTFSLLSPSRCRAPCGERERERRMVTNHTIVIGHGRGGKSISFTSDRVMRTRLFICFLALLMVERCLRGSREMTNVKEAELQGKLL